MSKLNRKQVENVIASYRNHGYKDYEIVDILSKSTSPVGKYYQQVAQAGFADDFVKDYGLNTKVGLADKAKSMAESAFVGGAKAWAGAVELGLKADDTKNALINKGASAVMGRDVKPLNTNKAENYRKEVDDVIRHKDDSRKAVGRDGIDWVDASFNMISSAPKYVLGGGAGAGAKLSTRLGEQAIRGGLDGLTQHASNNKEMGVNTALGAVGGVGGELIGTGIRKGATKAYNAVKGNKTTHAVEIENLGKQHGVNLSAGDISKNAVMRNAEIQMERVPLVGMSGYRQTQQNQAKQSALNIQAKFEKALNDTDFKAFDKLQAKARQGDAKAKTVLDKANNATTPEQILQASLEIKDWRMREIAKSKYDLVQKELDKLPASQDKTIAPTMTKAKLAEGEHIIRTSLAPDDEMAREIKKFTDNLNDPNRPKDYANFRKLRSQIGNMAYKYEGIGNPNPDVTNYLKELRTAVEQDISNFASTSGNPAIKTAYQKADKFYHAMKKQQDKDHAKAMNSSTPDQIYQIFVKKGQGDRAENFYNALDAKGQSAIRYKMIEEAIEKAYDPNLGENGVFSPAKFAGEFDRLAKPYERVFKGADKDEMDGFIKLMQHIERAGQYAENPANGSRLADFAIMGGAMTAPVVVIKAGVGTAMAKALFTTKAGKNLLLAAKELPPNASGFDKLLTQAKNLAGVGMANLAVQVSSNVQEPLTDPQAYTDNDPLWDDDDWQDDEWLAQNPHADTQPMDTQGGVGDFTAPQVADYLPEDFGTMSYPSQPSEPPPSGEMMSGEMSDTGNDGTSEPITADSIGQGLANLIPPPKNPENMGNYERYTQAVVGRLMSTPAMQVITRELASAEPNFNKIGNAQKALKHSEEWQRFERSLPPDVKQKVAGANILALLTNSQIHGNSEFFNPTF